MLKGYHELIEGVDSYYSYILECQVERNVNTGLRCCETDRRLQSEEGCGPVWPVLILRKKDAWWVSVAPGLLEEISPIIRSFSLETGFGSSLIESLKTAISKHYEVKAWWHSLLFVPSEKIKQFGLLAGNIIRPLTFEEAKDKLPKESVKAGTALGVFVDGELASWAEATPLPTVTKHFGVMPVGIETALRYRRRGFGQAVLSKLTKLVLGMSKIPLYGCAIDNIASQRTAMSCGYELYGETLRFHI